MIIKRFELMRKLAWWIGLLSVLLVCCSALASAFGVTPGDKTVNYAPGESVELAFSLINNEGSEVQVALSAMGELEGFLSFSEPTVFLNKSEYLTPFKVILAMPPEMKPGIHTVFAKATPILSGPGEMFKAFVSVAIPIHIRVPYPEKYAEVSIGVLPAGEGTPVPINLEFDNLGSEDISSAGGSIQVYSPNGGLVENLTAPAISVPKNSFAKSEGQPIIALWPGVYTAEAQAYYDGKSVPVSRSFSVGEPTARLSGVSESITADRVSPVKFRAASEWNVPLEVSGVIIIEGVESEMPVFTLEPGVESEVTAYYDATFLAAGEKDMVIRLALGSTVKDYTFKVDARPAGLLPQAMNANAFLFPALLLLLIISVVVLWLARRRKKKKGGEGGEAGEEGSGGDETDENNEPDNEGAAAKSLNSPPPSGE
jgi:hypothetical protein